MTINIGYFWWTPRILSGATRNWTSMVTTYNGENRSPLTDPCSLALHIANPMILVGIFILKAKNCMARFAISSKFPWGPWVTESPLHPVYPTHGLIGEQTVHGTLHGPSKPSGSWHLLMFARCWCRPWLVWAWKTMRISRTSSGLFLVVGDGRGRKLFQLCYQVQLF